LAIEGERRRRFVPEAKAASALNHPNIITIYEIGETGKQALYRRRIYDGETLHRQLKRGPFR